jgi:hypothetical protein
MKLGWFCVLFASLSTASGSPVTPTDLDRVKEPPLIWRLVSGVLKRALGPLVEGREIPEDVCQVVCTLDDSIKTSIAAAVCGGALLTQAWGGIVCPV